MRKVSYLKVLAVAVPAMALLLSVGALAGLGGQQGNSTIEPDPPDPGGDDCICPHVWDPVVCNVNGERQRFSNACFAGCAGATQCEDANNSLDP